ncbi:MAG: alpha-ketoacid dehydrogenase subunit beta [Candidatus Eremiobacteraeota bacterium]|nr:alpha-ketoacid dehydrogenase subunit beta [Candidatus Eremiobacteraeota bacterium]
MNKVDLSMKDAINLALTEEMERDGNVFIMGEDIGVYGGAFGVTAGLLDKFGEDGIVETPISEGSLMGIATGSALMGMRPVLEIMFMDFTTLIIDQVLNHAVKFRYMFGGRDDIRVPLVIRTPYGGGRAYGASHSQSLEGLFLHIPGLKILVPSTPADARGLLKSAIRDNNPVLFLESKLLYNKTGQVPKDDNLIPIGKAKVVIEGEDITLLSYGRTLDMCREAADYLENEGYKPEVIDLRSLNPLDKKAITKSVEKTGRVVVVEEGTLTGGVGAELCSVIMENAFFSLESPPERVAAMDLPVPYSPVLEAEVLPGVGDIVEASLRSLSY